YGDSEGFVTQRLIDYYTERAKNMVGLVIIEIANVAPGGRAQPNQLGIHDDKFIPGLRKLADSVKQTGARCFLQLHHGGRHAMPAWNGGVQPVAPSPIPRRGGIMPRELTIAEIDGIIEAFAQGANRAKKAGFDGVELHFAHTYLIQQFLSPLTNSRRDKYGGDFISRARIALEITQQARALVGPDYPLSARICGDEYIKGGISLKEAKSLAVMLEAASVNVLNVTVGYNPSHEEGFFNCLNISSCVPMSRPYGCNAHLAEAIKQKVKIPVIAVGRLDNPEIASDVIAKGKADFIAIGRALISDAAYVSKVYSNKRQEIRKCIACKRCLATLPTETNMRCTVNPEVGMESEYRIKPAGKTKKVLVVGGGPAGMEAARVAASRGHKVILMDKNSRLGGNLISAAGVSFKHDINFVAEYLGYAIKQAGVEIKLITEATTENVLALKPDVVILATGSVPVLPDIPGINRGNVNDAVKVLEGRATIGDNVIVAGGGDVGCEVGVYLAERGKNVTVVEMRDTDWSDTGGLAPEMDSELRKWLLGDLLPVLPISVIGKVMFSAITENGMVVEDREGQRRLIHGDSIVIAAGMKSENKLKEKLEGKVPELYAVGDCIKARKIMDAIAEAAHVAHSI
ncbi:MAG TPA: FAD-dependent oxidoreductase, partial [Dehalococcoidales bacterium]|nr:FAD-dependent oxidoreductase [Dehalococcoidales bacterium]